MADIYVRAENGTVIQMTLPLPEAIEERMTKGQIRRVNADGSAFLEGTEGAPVVATTPTKRPSKNAPKAEWVGWAVRCGADPDAADAQKKDELIELYGEPASEAVADALAEELAARDQEV